MNLKVELFEESITLPTQYEINEYQIIVDFIDTINNLEIKNNLQRLIQGKGAFRRFKDYCFETNIIQDWYEFKEQKYKEIAINGCEQNELYENKIEYSKFTQKYKDSLKDSSFYGIVAIEGDKVAGVLISRVISRIAKKKDILFY